MARKALVFRVDEANRCIEYGLDDGENGPISAGQFAIVEGNIELRGPVRLETLSEATSLLVRIGSVLDRQAKRLGNVEGDHFTRIVTYLRNSRLKEVEHFDRSLHDE